MKAAALVTIALSACATAQRPRWLPVDGPYVAERPGFEVAVPADWVRDAKETDLLLISRDGPSLQRIQVGSADAGKPLGIGSGARLVSAGMTPADLAVLFTDDVRATVPVVRLVERAPAVLAGREATRVVVSYLDPKGLRRRVAFCGFVAGERAYYVAYFAPERHYFPLDLAVYEEVARSFRLRPAAAPAVAR